MLFNIGAADLPQNLCKTMQKYDNLCIIKAIKNKDLAISWLLGVRVVARSNRVAPTNKIKDLRVFCESFLIFMLQICSAIR